MSLPVTYYTVFINIKFLPIHVTHRAYERLKHKNVLGNLATGFRLIGQELFSNLTTCIRIMIKSINTRAAADRIGRLNSID